MDLTQQIYVQCINCHSNIFAGSGPQRDGSICENCLFYESKLINQEKQELSTLQHELYALRQFGAKEAKRDRNETKGLEDSQREINELEFQLQKLGNQQQLFDNNQRQLEFRGKFLAERFQYIQQTAQNQCQGLRGKYTELNALCESQAQLLGQILQLRKKKESLQGYSVLMELYHIHFDDQHAFINREAINISNMQPLLEIISYLAKKYDFHAFDIKVAESSIAFDNGCMVSFQKSTFKGVKAWVQVVVRKTVQLWQHIKQVCSLETKQNYDYYALPFKIVLQPQLSINDKSLTSQTSYASFLKYFTHNIKYMMSFDFDVELRSFARWQPGKSYALQSFG